MSTIDEKTLKEKRAENSALEKSAEYKRILPEVMNEVYAQFVEYKESMLKEKIEKEKKRTGSDELSVYCSSYLERIDFAKKMLNDSPEKAVDYLYMFGDCHLLWSLQKQILKEKYGITWYTPSELEPTAYFD